MQPGPPEDPGQRTWSSPVAYDPRTQLTTQELIYAASALRAEARRAERQAADPQYESVRSLFEDAAKIYDALAGKLTWIAERVKK